MEMNPVVHFEMPAKDKGRMRKFYETAFGWQTEQHGKEMGEYVLVTTTERDEKTGLPRRPGAINGGFYHGIGLYASFIDTEGNRAGMLQPAPMKSNPKE